MRKRINIQSELKRAGITQVSIANMLKIRPSSVHNVITGKRSTPRIRQAIALAIGLPVSAVFPIDQEPS
jgi:lambda repressor-like predicted transcriptional regulator